MRIKTSTLFIPLLSVLTVLRSASPAFAQGSLTPPAGAPAPTMRTLMQTEPRIPIDVAPFTITQPGSYYLTTNLVTASSGITISTNSVTLDLMGFAVSRAGQASGFGISVVGGVSAPCRAVVVRNGSVRNFQTGVRLVNALNCRIEGLASFDNSSTGLLLDGDVSSACIGNVLAGCEVFDNGSYGIRLSASLGSCDGNSIVRCTVTGNGAHPESAHYGGIYFYGNTGSCKGNRVEDCLLRNNSGNGIFLYYVSQNIIENNRVSATGGVGIRTDGSATSGNLIVKNVCMGHTTNYSLSATDGYGPVVVYVGALSTADGAPALSPWANFSK